MHYDLPQAIDRDADWITQTEARGTSEIGARTLGLKNFVDLRFRHYDEFSYSPKLYKITTDEWTICNATLMD